MTTLALVTVAWASGVVLGAFFGYFIPKLYARSVAQAVERERAVAALAGGQTPSWERTAAELEQAAIAQAKKGNTSSSQTLLDQATEVRVRGKAGR